MFTIQFVFSPHSKACKVFGTVPVKDRRFARKTNKSENTCCLLRPSVLKPTITLAVSGNQVFLDQS